MPPRRRPPPPPPARIPWALGKTMIISLGAMAGALVALNAAWTAFDMPPWSTRVWTLAQIETLKQQLNSQSEVLRDIRRGQIDRNIIDLEAKKRRQADEELRLRQLREDLRRLDIQVDKNR